MTREEFKQILDDKGYPYEMEGNKIVVTGKGDVWLESLTSLPPGVVFENGGRHGGSVFFESLINVGFIGDWEGNIEGIGSKRLLNKMIADGLFDRK